MYKTDIDDYLAGYPAYTLFAISGFKSKKSNELADRNVDLDNTQFSLYQNKIKEMRDYINPPRAKTDKRYRKVRKTFIKSGYVLVSVYLYLYINTKNVLDNFGYQCIKSRGQPPPFWKGKRLIKSLTDISYIVFKQIGIKSIKN